MKSRIFKNSLLVISASAFVGCNMTMSPVDATASSQMPDSSETHGLCHVFESIQHAIEETEVQVRDLPPFRRLCRLSLQTLYLFAHNGSDIWYSDESHIFETTMRSIHEILSNNMDWNEDRSTSLENKALLPLCAMLVTYNFHPTPIVYSHVTNLSSRVSQRSVDMSDPLWVLSLDRILARFPSNTSFFSPNENFKKSDIFETEFSLECYALDGDTFSKSSLSNADMFSSVDFTLSPETVSSDILMALEAYIAGGEVWKNVQHALFQSIDRKFRVEHVTEENMDEWLLIGIFLSEHGTAVLGFEQ